MVRGTYHHGALRDAILDAATEIVREEGITGFTLAKGARLTGVSTGAPYQHFGGGREALIAVAARGYQGLERRFAELADDAISALERLESMTLTYIAYALEDSARFRVMAAFGDAVMTHPDYSECTRAVDERWHRAAAQVARPDRAGELAFALIAFAHGSAQLATDQLYADAHALRTAQVLRTSRRIVRTLIDDAVAAGSTTSSS